MTRGVVGRSSRRREARIRISIDKEHRIEDFERNFVVEKEKKTIELFVLYACTLLHSSSARPLFLRRYCSIVLESLHG